MSNLQTNSDVLRNVKEISKNKYFIEKEGNMRTNVELFLSESLFKQVDSTAIQQIKNVATLPGIVGNALAMPDVHSGYGFPIGGVAAFDYEKGVVSPGGIGFDINCGVRLMTSNISVDEIAKQKENILKSLFEEIPSGLGAENKTKISKDDLLEILSEGVNFAVKKGFATKQDKESIEDYGKLPSSVDYLSQRAISRGLAQIGTLGSGNHFVEVQKVEEVYDKKLAEKWGLKKDSLTLMIHSGSRGFGHQVATDFIKLFLESKSKYEYKLVDDQLASVPIQSVLGQKYLKSMHAAANFAYVNRQMMGFKAKDVFAQYGVELKLLYDVAHNIAKKETYVVDGKERELLVHRKGATRAFSKGNKLLPEKYKDTGQPVILPGSMGTYSYVLVGDRAEELSFGSVAHGAGRVMSRSKAMQELNYENVTNELRESGVTFKTKTQKGLIQEAPESYKDISEVTNVLVKNKLVKPVVKLKPIMVLKG